jgi:hypothetical protein
LDQSQGPSKRLNARFAVAHWGMLGNDHYGDCVWAGAAHETMLWNKEAARNVLKD